MVEDLLGIFGGIGWAVSVNDLGIKNCKALSLPKADDTFVSTCIGFCGESGRMDV